MSYSVDPAVLAAAVAAEGAVVRSGRVTERLLEWGCAGCSATVTYGGRGRRRRYCTAACRQRACALRQADRMRGTPADPRPAVVREVVERVVERIVEPRVRNGVLLVAPSTPESPPDWAKQLAALAVQLRDPAHRVAREHWHHRRLLAILTEAAQALDEAHPGGLGRRHR